MSELLKRKYYSAALGKFVNDVFSEASDLFNEPENADEINDYLSAVEELLGEDVPEIQASDKVSALNASSQMQQLLQLKNESFDEIEIRKVMIKNATGSFKELYENKLKALEENVEEIDKALAAVESVREGINVSGDIQGERKKAA